MHCAVQNLKSIKMSLNLKIFPNYVSVSTKCFWYLIILDTKLFSNRSKNPKKCNCFKVWAVPITNLKG